MPKLVVFDCDGVLVDSELLVLDIESRILAAAGFDVTADRLGHDVIGRSRSDVLAAIEMHCGKPVPDTLNKQMQAAALVELERRLLPVPGIHETLDVLNVQRCVASSSSLERIRLSLKVTGLDRHFRSDFIFSSEMVRRGKPAPDLFLHAATEVGIEPGNCLVVEDSPHGVRGARAAGMHVVGFTAGSHAKHALKAELLDAGAANVVESANDLAHAFNSL